MEGGTESRKSLVPLLWGTTGPADANWDGASTAVSVCTVYLGTRQTMWPMAAVDCRQRAAGGIAAAESEVVGQQGQAGQGRNGRRSGWLSG